MFRSCFCWTFCTSTAFSPPQVSGEDASYFHLVSSMECSSLLLCRKQATMVECNSARLVEKRGTNTQWSFQTHQTFSSQNRVAAYYRVLMSLSQIFKTSKLCQDFIMLIWQRCPYSKVNFVTIVFSMYSRVQNLEFVKVQLPTLSVY